MANINRYDDLNTGAIAYATFLSCIALVVIILGIRALCFAWVEGEADRKMANAHYTVSDEEISEQKGRLSGYRKEAVEVVTTPEDGGDPVVSSETVIRIPLDRAKELLFQDATK